MKGGQKLSKNQKYQMVTDKKVQKLIIHDVTIQDKAEYTCIYGETSTWAKLVVEEEERKVKAVPEPKFKPEFIKKLGQLRVQERDIATFVCEMSYENLTPIWMKGGQKLTANKKYEIITDKKVQKLIIHDVSFEDKAEYICIFGETSTWAKLIVEEPKVEVKAEPVAEFKAEFTHKLSEITAKEKDTVTFVCEMSQENLTPIWMKGGQKLTTDNKYEIVTDKKVQKLTIRHVTVEDKGEYTCIYRDTSTWAKLVVGEIKTEFTKKLSEIRVKEKETAIFVCEMSEENLKAIWMKGGQKLTADKKYEMVTDKKIQKLIIHDITVKDKGEYTCIYRDTSTWAKLNVEEIKAEFSKKLSEMKAKVKETATFVCEMSEENVKPIWMKGGQKLTADNKYQMVTDKKTQKLIISDITVEDKGEYTCIYRDTSTWAKLVVEETKAEFTQKLTEMKVKVKETATFTCELSTENIKPVWLKNGKELTSSKRIEMISEKKTHKLVIHEVTVEDKGEYTCVVGSVSTTAKLVVEVSFALLIYALHFLQSYLEWSSVTESQTGWSTETESRSDWSTETQTQSEPAVESETTIGWSAETESRSGECICSCIMRHFFFNTEK
ncbi:unnamed protein product [Acanthosepion pharaonis]|uniref:Ig-like domain-containing protein n=1 Tax=Acanthosepion pharaonis TaxID=158019 RepID=A0A812BSV6_ACAPH|nr:unnamed protein product [Sepia pharaonis]